MKKPCEVCGIITSTVCYKLFICPSCRIFYRRNFQFSGKVQCRNDGNCNLQFGARRSCQTCRLRICRELGLRMVGKSLVVQVEGEPKDDVSDIPIKNASKIQKINTEKISPTTKSEQLLLRFPLLQRVANSFREFHERQLFIATAEREDELLSDDAENSKFMNKMQFNKMEEKVLWVAVGTVAGLLNELPDLDKEERAMIIKETVLNVSIVLKIYLTCKRFPSIGDSKMATFSGYHYDTADCDSFLVGLPKDFIVKSRAIYDPLMARCRLTLDRMKHANVSQVEYAVLLAYCIYERADKQENSEIRQAVFDLRDRLLAELSAYLQNFHSPQEVCIRMSRLFACIHDVKHCHEFYVDSYALSGVFMPEFANELYSQLPEVSDNHIKNIVSFMNLSMT